MGTLKKIAQFFSYFVHPLLLPVYGVGFVFNSDSVFSLTPAGIKLYCYGITFLFLCLLPVATMPLLKKMRLISSYALAARKERLFPILMSIVYAFVGFYFIKQVPYTNIIQQLYLVLIILLAAFSIVTVCWKMSMHMTAIGAVCGFLLILGFRYFANIRYTFMLVTALAGILGTCRLYLGKHNPAQIYAGFLFGLSVVMIILI